MMIPAVIQVLRGISLLPIWTSAIAPPPTFQLPAPTGQFGVGTTSWLVADPQRTETFLTTPIPREIKVFAWYPIPPRVTASSAGRAPYLRESLAEAQTFATVVRSPGAFSGLATVLTHSIVDEPMLSGSGKLPLLVFSHGYAGLVSAYTSLVEDLASHGFIVVSIAHPYEAMAVTLSQARFATLLDASGAVRREVREVMAEWGIEDSTMAQATRAPTEAEQLRILQEYFRGLPKTHEVIDRWVEDTRLVLDKLSELPSGTLHGQLARRVDMARIGVLGHSMGGVVAGQFCVDDARCRAGLNLDGIPQSGSMIETTMKAPFLMVYSARPGRLGASDAIYRRAASVYYRVDVADTRHLDFSDMNFWGGPLDAPGAHGPMAPLRAAELTRIIVREYFDQELRGNDSPLLNRTRTVPEVNARRVR